jgi:hypothetical protein
MSRNETPLTPKRRRQRVSQYLECECPCCGAEVGEWCNGDVDAHRTVVGSGIHYDRVNKFNRIRKYGE